MEGHAQMSEMSFQIMQKPLCVEIFQAVTLITLLYPYVCEYILLNLLLYFFFLSKELFFTCTMPNNEGPIIWKPLVSMTLNINSNKVFPVSSSHSSKHKRIHFIF